MQQNLIRKHPLSLKKTNPVEGKEAMLKVKTNKATGYDNIPGQLEQSRNHLKYLAILSMYFLTTSWKIQDTSTMETRCRLTSFQKGLLPNEIRNTDR